MDLYCAACRVAVPAAKQVIGKGVGSLIGGALGVRARSPGGLVLSVLAGFALGAMVDELAKPICGHCSRPLVARR